MGNIQKIKASARILLGTIAAYYLLNACQPDEQAEFQGHKISLIETDSIDKKINENLKFAIVEGQDTIPITGDNLYVNVSPTDVQNWRQFNQGYLKALEGGCRGAFGNYAAVLQNDTLYQITEQNLITQGTCR